MRCIGAENPPCVRCTRRGKECVVIAPNRHPSSRQSRPRASGSSQAEKGSNSNLPREDGGVQGNSVDAEPASAVRLAGDSNPSSAQRESDLPSVYSVSPIAAFNISDAPRNLSRREQGAGQDPQTLTHPTTPVPQMPPEHELTQLIQL